ncbi:MAG: hypothetical protein ABR978_03140 [Dehalococcoidia bacterium]|jgi:hypothetical protein
MDARRTLRSLGILEEGEAAPSTPLLLLALLFPLGLAVATYFNFMRDGFALDDFILLHRVTDVDILTHLRRSLALPRSLPYGGGLSSWRPLGMAYFFLARNTFGLNAAPYHVVNLVLHGLNAALLVILVILLTRSRVAALVAGTLFVVFPAYDIGVTWISQVFELLAAFFVLLCMVLFIVYLRTGPSSRMLYWGALAAAFLALLSKESAVFLLPALGPLLLVVEGPKVAWESRRRNMAILAPFAVVALAFALFMLVQEYGLDTGRTGYRLGGHLLRNYWAYLRWITFPFPSTWGSWVLPFRTAGAWLLLVGAAVAVILRRHVAIFLLLWLFLAIFPYVSFSAGTELRYTYQASLPFAALLAVVLAGLYQRAVRVWREAAPVASAICLFGLVLFFSIQTRDHQEWLHIQAAGFQVLLRDVNSECHLQPQGSVFVLNSPLFDPYGDRIPAAIDLYHADISVVTANGVQLPPLSAQIEDRCVLVYQDGRYQAVVLQQGSQLSP